MQMLTDIPYLEPLLFWLRADDTLKQHFTDKSYFMPHKDLVSAVFDAAKKDCPAPRALWILPGDTAAGASKTGCKSVGVHSFSIAIFVQCIRDAFQISKGQDGLFLDGQFMELMRLRKLVKDSVHKFAVGAEGTIIGRKYEGLTWVRDQILYPTEEMSLLASASFFDIKINP